MTNFDGENITSVAKIKVIGVGGGGNNAINRMLDSGINTATFIAANTDMQALNASLAPVKIQLGAEITKGLGAGSDPEKGRAAAEESIDEIRSNLENTNLLFITAGMGGGTGTGAAPVIARLAKEMDILTIAIVTKPFETIEGKKRMDKALMGIEELKKYVDTLIVIPNDKISAFVPKDTPVEKAFMIADDILKQGVQGISRIITTPSLINLDFADVKTIIQKKGSAHIGIGRWKGENKALEAVRQAVQSPLLDTDVGGAKGIIIYVEGDENMTIQEVEDSVKLINDVVDPDCETIVGMGTNTKLKNEVMITLIATGVDNLKQRMAVAAPNTNAEREKRISILNEYKKSSHPRDYLEKEAEIPSSRISVEEDDEFIPQFLRKIQKKD